MFYHKNKQLIIYVVSILLILLSTHANASLAKKNVNIPSGVLHGTIIDNETGQPISDARIEAGKFVTYSENNGYYRFSFIPENTYDLVVFASLFNFEIFRDIRITADKTVELNISLNKNYQPFVYTGSASMITCKSAMFNGSVQPKGLHTTAYFEYGPSQTYGMKTSLMNAGHSLDPISINMRINTLEPETQYHYRLVAHNSDGTTFGNDQVFATDVPILNVEKIQKIALPSGQSIVKSFFIQNQGCDPLIYHLSVSGAVAISPNTNISYPDIAIPEKTEGTIDSGLSHAISIKYTANTMPYGNYEIVLTLQHNALNYPNPYKMTIPIQITSPKITVTPRSFHFEVQKGNTKKDTVTIGNSGNTELKWKIQVKGGKQSNKNPQQNYSAHDKDPADEQKGRINTDHFGGPDGFGYIWSDSFANAGPSYEWIDISQSGTALSNLKDDDSAGPIDIGFSFPFYGQNYETFFVSSNGFIGFVSSAEYAGHKNMPIPDAQAPSNIIAPLWDDLSPEDGAIYYYRQQKRLIVQFENMKQYQNDGFASFQVILDQDGSILFQYKSLTHSFNANSSTVGIENSDGTDGLEVAFNMNYLQSQMAIRFEPNQCSWLKIYQASTGAIPPAQKIDISIGADTTYLFQERYQCNLVVTSDDLLNPVITIPVRLDVIASKPEIAVTPGKLTFELMENEQGNKKLSIMNKGSHPLVWNMISSCNPEENTGYYWIDSDMPGGPIFDWIDISSTGNKVDQLKDDISVGPFPIGFSFPFYGEFYDKFYISSNGLIGFGDTVGLTERANEKIPEKRKPGNFLAWFWDDLTPRNAHVYYQTMGQKLIVSFIDYGQFGSSGTVTAQVIIHSDGSILYQYDHFRDGISTNEATIGLENKQGDEGVLVTHNQAYLHDSLAIRFHNNPCTWLRVAPLSGKILPMSTESVDVQAAPSGMSQGEYDAVLRIESNDNNNSLVDIPVHLIVKGQSHAPVIRSNILIPQENNQIYATTLPIKGTASATEKETINRVEISFDHGKTWKVATGTNQWRYEWSVPSESGQYTICVRAIGQSGNYQPQWSYTKVHVVSRLGSRITINNRALSVDDSPFQVKGVGYAPTPIGHDPEIRAPYGDYFTSDYHRIHERDFPMLRMMGANTLRLWAWHPGADHTRFLDAAYNNGLDPIYIIAGFQINSGYNIDPDDPQNKREMIKQDFLDMVHIHKNHPAILMWCIGNELNADGMYGQYLDDLFSLINEMGLAAKQLEGQNYHPTTTPLIDVYLNNIINTYDSKMPGLSVWGANVYRGKSFGDLFSNYGGWSDKPIIILEFGIDAMDNSTKQEYEKSGSAKQSEYARALWREIDQHKSVCIGGSIMAYADEWWKGKHSADPLCNDEDPLHHGFCGYSISAHPDGYANEEWWGIMRKVKNGNNIDKVQPRSVYYELQKAWNFNPIPTTETKLIPPECETSDNFGRSVAIYGNHAASGAKGDDDKGGNAGAVYILNYTDKKWEVGQKVMPDDAVSNDYFGCSVAMFDQYAIFGAYGRDDAGSKSGAAYLYSSSSTGWQQHQKLTADDSEYNDYFGFAVDISENYAIIGAYGDDDKGNLAGAAYVFKRQTDNTWVQQQKLVYDQGEKTDKFGSAVAITDDYAIIGVYGDDDKGDSSGSALIFKRNQDMWILTAKLLADDGQANDYFGYDVSISGDYAVVGAYRCDDGSRENVGGAYVFKYEMDTWNFQTKLVPSQGLSNDYFGASVDIVGTRILIGAYGDDDKGSSSGASYLYILEGDQWNMMKKYVPDDGSSYDNFAFDIAIADQGLIMGAYGNDDKGSLAGAVYIYSQGEEEKDSSRMSFNSDTLIKKEAIFMNQNQSQFMHFKSHSQQHHDETINTTSDIANIDSMGKTASSNMLIEINQMPPIGNRLLNIEGQVTPFDPDKYAIVVAIHVNDQWRIKPGKNRTNGMQVQNNGQFSCDITTEPLDHLATKIAVLVVPASVNVSDINDVDCFPVVSRRIFKR